MMIRAFILLLAILIGGWFVADSMKQLGPGYVLVYFNHYSLETSVWVGGLLLLAAVLLCYLFIRLIASLFQFSRYTLQIRSRRKRRWLEQSVSSFLQGDYADASRFALKNGQFEDYILASRAALLAGDAESARAYMGKAATAEDIKLFTLSLLHYDVAEFQQQKQESSRLLQRLLEHNPQHIAVLKRAVEHYLKYMQLEHLFKLLSGLQKRQKPQHQNLQKQLVIQAAKALIVYAQQQNNEQQLQEIWHVVSKTAARNELLADYCLALIAMKKEQEAERFLFKRLRSVFDESCLLAYAQLNFNSKKQLDYLQTMDQQHPYNAKLQIALAVVFMKLEQWDEAKYALDKSLQIKASIEAYKQLASYYQKSGQLGLALQSLHKALSFS